MFKKGVVFLFLIILVSSFCLAATPQIFLNSPTPNASDRVLESFTVNVSAIGNNNLTIFLYNEGDFLIQTNTTASSTLEITYSDLQPGNYSFEAVACDASSNCNTTAEREIIYTRWMSILAVPLEVGDFTTSSSTYEEITTIEFNTSIPTTFFGVVDAFNVEKQTGAGDNQVYVRVSVDGTPISEDLVRTVSVVLGSREAGVTMTSPVTFNVSAGSHNLTLEIRRTGNGAVLLNDFDMSLIELVSNYGYDIFRQEDSPTFTFDQPTFEPVYDSVFTTEVPSGVFTFAKFPFNASGATNAVCVATDNNFNISAPPVVNTLSATGRVAVSSLNGPSFSTGGLINTSVVCSSSTGETVTSNPVFYNIALRDNRQNPTNRNFAFNPLASLTNPLNLTEGTYKLASFNLTVQNGTGVQLASYSSISSNTGSQEALFFMNSTQAGIDCFSKKDRTIGEGNYGSIFMFPICDGLTANNTYEFNIYTTVAAGEELVFYGSLMSGFEVSPFNTSIANSAPIVAITDPFDTAIVSGNNATVNWTTFDIQGDRLLTNVTLINGINYTLGTNIPDTTNFLNIDWGNYLDDSYMLVVESCENETADKLCSNDTITIFVDNGGLIISNYSLCSIKDQPNKPWDIPCIVIHDAASACGLLDVSVINKTTQEYYQSNLGPYGNYCGFIFNQTSLGDYFFDYSDGGKDFLTVSDDVSPTEVAGIAMSNNIVIIFLIILFILFILFYQINRSSRS